MRLRNVRSKPAAFLMITYRGGERTKIEHGASCLGLEERDTLKLDTRQPSGSLESRVAGLVLHFTGTPNILC